MLKTLPAVSYTEVNKSQNPPITLLGAHGLITATMFGQADKPYEIQTVQQFLDTFGSYGATSPFFASIIRALSRGTTLFIQRLLATGATAASIALDTSLVTIHAKDFGSWANATLSVQYTTLAAGVGGVAGTNQLLVQYNGNSNRNEVWQSTSLAGLIALVNASSTLINITTGGGFTEPASSAGTPVFLATGTDGTFVSQATTDAAVAALFTNFDDSTLFPIQTLSSTASHSAAHYGNLNTYVSARGDIMGIFEFDPAASPATNITLAAGFAASEFMATYYSSTITAYNPQQGVNVTSGCLLDVLAVWAVSDTISGNVYSAPAGSRRGTIPNIISFAVNLLSPGKLAVANTLVAASINVVGSDPSFGPIVWGAQTFYQSNTALDAINVRRTLTSLNQQVKPIYCGELFQPMDPITWRDAYTKVKAILNTLVSDQGIYSGFTYVGDQESSTIGDAKYNKPADLANGIYKVAITVVPVGYISQIKVELDINNLTTLFNTNVTVSN